jgi:H+-translocating NAD(P) transhydrogenase subunit alpha
MRTLSKNIALPLLATCALFAAGLAWSQAAPAADKEGPAAKPAAAPATADTAPSKPASADEVTHAPAASHGQANSELEAPLTADTTTVINAIYILVLAGFVGFEVIGRVSPLLHTPLMSATNAISGISLVGSLVAAGNKELGTVSNVLGFIAVTAATINVVGGFMITDRMLRMFKSRGAARHE